VRKFFVVAMIGGSPYAVGRPQSPLPMQRAGSLSALPSPAVYGVPFESPYGRSRTPTAAPPRFHDAEYPPGTPQSPARGPVRMGGFGSVPVPGPRTMTPDVGPALRDRWGAPAAALPRPLMSNGLTKAASISVTSNDAVAPMVPPPDRLKSASLNVWPAPVRTVPSQVIPLVSSVSREFPAGNGAVEASMAPEEEVVLVPEDYPGPAPDGAEQCEPQSEPPPRWAQAARTTSPTKFSPAQRGNRDAGPRLRLGDASSRLRSESPQRKASPTLKPRAEQAGKPDPTAQLRSESPARVVAPRATSPSRVAIREAQGNGAPSPAAPRPSSPMPRRPVWAEGNALPRTPPTAATTPTEAPVRVLPPAPLSRKTSQALSQGTSPLQPPKQSSSDTGVDGAAAAKARVLLRKRREEAGARRQEEAQLQVQKDKEEKARQLQQNTKQRLAARKKSQQQQQVQPAPKPTEAQLVLPSEDASPVPVAHVSNKKLTYCFTRERDPKSHQMPAPERWDGVNSGGRSPAMSPKSDQMPAPGRWDGMKSGGRSSAMSPKSDQMPAFEGWDGVKSGGRSPAMSSKKPMFPVRSDVAPMRNPSPAKVAATLWSSIEPTAGGRRIPAADLRTWVRQEAEEDIEQMYREVTLGHSHLLASNELPEEEAEPDISEYLTDVIIDSGVAPATPSIPPQSPVWRMRSMKGCRMGPGDVMSRMRQISQTRAGTGAGTPDVPGTSSPAPSW